MSTKKIYLDEDVLEFYKTSIFRNYANIYETAGRKAYLDLNRTLRYKKTPFSDREEIVNKVTQLLEHEINWIETKEAIDQKAFDT